MKWKRVSSHERWDFPSLSKIFKSILEIIAPSAFFNVKRMKGRIIHLFKNILQPHQVLFGIFFSFYTVQRLIMNSTTKIGVIVTHVQYSNYFSNKTCVLLRTTLHYHEKGSRISCQLFMSRKWKNGKIFKHFLWRWIRKKNRKNALSNVYSLNSI